MFEYQEKWYGFCAEFRSKLSDGLNTKRNGMAVCANLEVIDVCANPVVINVCAKLELIDVCAKT